MPRVAIDQPAPDFELLDYKGNRFRLSDFKNVSHVLLVLNRGFT